MRITASPSGMSVIALLAALLLTWSAWADGPPAPKDLVKAELLAETASIAPGATLWVDLHLEIRPGWHIYWRNPGDSGLPTAIDWKLPRGFSAGHILWPVPEHFVQNGIGNYGYAGTADLLVPITVPGELAARQARLEAEASWLACAEICIPGSAELGELACCSADLRPRPCDRAAVRCRSPSSAGSGVVRDPICVGLARFPIVGSVRRGLWTAEPNGDVFPKQRCADRCRCGTSP